MHLPYNLSLDMTKVMNSSHDQEFVKLAELPALKWLKCLIFDCSFCVNCVGAVCVMRCGHTEVSNLLLLLLPSTWQMFIA